MPDPNAVRRLLEGEIDPSEIEEDPDLYAMAERIYGSEALEEMGVVGPRIASFSEESDMGLISDDVTLPDFLPNVREIKENAVREKKKRRLGVFFVGFLGIAGTVFNMAIGAGKVLCSVGAADWKVICNEEYGRTKLVWTNGYSYDRLYETDTWVKPMSEPLMGDILLVAFFTLIAIMGILSKKK